ncbi:hypothetical protein VV02_24895 [Luteipulveratus mongoliensis]|uniref:Uncharacterized protein n=1 Tax=Luteipulveratus mongoliensis TaxID=571913 RepID=A0A0K1JP11_9MICO|nr:hypothetical protein VV02_24895 [Luteipulveratus mongoliensis]
MYVRLELAAQDPFGKGALLRRAEVALDQLGQHVLTDAVAVRRRIGELFDRRQEPSIPLLALGLPLTAQRNPRR